MKRSLESLDRVNAEPIGTYNDVSIDETMEWFADEPDGLLLLVERYGDSENADLINSLCFVLSRTAFTHKSETAQAVIPLLSKLRYREWGPLNNVLCTMLRLLMYDTFYPQGQPPPPGLYPFLIDCLREGEEPWRSDVWGAVCQVVGGLYARGHLPSFPPEQLAELRRRLRSVLHTDNTLLQSELQGVSEFLAGRDAGPILFPLAADAEYPVEERERVAQALAELDRWAAQPPARPDPVGVFKRMEAVAFSPGGLPLLVERYGGFDGPQLLVPLGFFLRAATRGHRLAIAPLIIQVLERSKTRDEETLEILEWALSRAIKQTRERWFSAENPAPPEEPPPLQEFLPAVAYCLGRGPDLRGGAMLTLGILHEEGQLSRFPPEQVADIRRRLQELSRDPDEQLQKDLKEVAEFLAEPA